MNKLPAELKKALFYIDKFAAYHEVIPWQQHSPVGKNPKRQTIWRDLIAQLDNDAQD